MFKTVTGGSPGCKHPFEKPLDGEQLFVVGWKAKRTPVPHQPRGGAAMAAIAYPTIHDQGVGQRSVLRLAPPPARPRRRYQLRRLVALLLLILLVVGAWTTVHAAARL